MTGIQFSLFTKPWKEWSISELCENVSKWGFDGIEFPLRDGYQVEPGQAERELPGFAKRLSDYGLRIYSVASSTEESIFSACAQSGIPLIRIMAPVDPGIGYVASEKRLKEQLEKLIPLCERYKIKIGVQQHHGDFVNDSNGLIRLVEAFDPQHIGVVWDAAHDALAGQQPEFGLDIVKSHLHMVNIKNAHYMKTEVPQQHFTQWTRYFTAGNKGLASWPLVAGALAKLKYNGVVCLTAQYSAEEFRSVYIREDLALAKTLFA